MILIRRLPPPPEAASLSSPVIFNITAPPPPLNSLFLRPLSVVSFLIRICECHI
ncbi:hypothetical protein HanIR_Chr06g0298441 [Helianthus annuus]|nr:hypothetical protein HanIR_Chr06g0298441 [Helianthus annuus]